MAPPRPRPRSPARLGSAPPPAPGSGAGAGAGGSAPDSSSSGRRRKKKRRRRQAAAKGLQPLFFEVSPRGCARLRANPSAAGCPVGSPLPRVKVGGTPAKGKALPTPWCCPKPRPRGVPRGCESRGVLGTMPWGLEMLRPKRAANARLHHTSSSHITSVFLL